MISRRRRSRAACRVQIIIIALQFNMKPFACVRVRSYVVHVECLLSSTPTPSAEQRTVAGRKGSSARVLQYVLMPYIYYIIKYMGSGVGGGRDTGSTVERRYAFAQ